MKKLRGKREKERVRLPNPHRHILLNVFRLDTDEANKLLRTGWVGLMKRNCHAVSIPSINLILCMLSLCGTQLKRLKSLPHKVRYLRLSILPTMLQIFIWGLPYCHMQLRIHRDTTIVESFSIYTNTPTQSKYIENMHRTRSLVRKASFLSIEFSAALFPFLPNSRKTNKLHVDFDSCVCVAIEWR